MIWYNKVYANTRSTDNNEKMALLYNGKYIP